MGLIAMSIPAFFVLIGVELLASRLRGAKVYRLGDSIADLSCGVLQQLTGAFIAVLTVGAYTQLHQHYALLQIDPQSPLAWVALFFGVDFFYYWFHRASHEINLLWAAHVVHHQSEEYNLTVALRQSALQSAFSWLFYLPLALIGFSTPMFLTMSALNTLYQFWIHTRLIGKLGPLEWVLNTPSHHRVHHGLNEQYIDKNHAGVLIIWDRLFGTFEPEREEVVFGVTEPPLSWNPIWVNLHTWVLTFRRAVEAKRPIDKLLVWFKPPTWEPPGAALAVPKSSVLAPVVHDPQRTAAIKAYVVLQFSLLIPLVLTFLGNKTLTTALLVAASITALGGVLDGRRWGWPLEVARLCGAGLMIATGMIF